MPRGMVVTQLRVLLQRREHLAATVWALSEVPKVGLVGGMGESWSLTQAGFKVGQWFLASKNMIVVVVCKTGFWGSLIYFQIPAHGLVKIEETQNLRKAIWFSIYFGSCRLPCFFQDDWPVENGKLKSGVPVKHGCWPVLRIEFWPTFECVQLWSDYCTPHQYSDGISNPNVPDVLKGPDRHLAWGSPIVV